LSWCTVSEVVTVRTLPPATDSFSSIGGPRAAHARTP
jgi:hypothetical protein